MGGEESEHLRRLEERLGQLTQLLIDAGDRLTEERARSDAQRLTLLRLIDLLAVNGRLDLEELRAALSLAEIRHQADVKDPNSAALADEIRQLRSELDRTLVLPHIPLRRDLTDVVLHAARQTLPPTLAAGRFVRERLSVQTMVNAWLHLSSRLRSRKRSPGPEDGADGGDRTRTGKPEGF